MSNNWCLFTCIVISCCLTVNCGKFLVENITSIISVQPEHGCFMHVQEYLTLKFQENETLSVTRPLSDNKKYKPTVIRNRYVNITVLSSDTFIELENNRRAFVWRKPGATVITFYFTGNRNDSTYSFLLDYYVEGPLMGYNITNNIITWPYNDIYKWCDSYSYINTVFKLYMAPNNLIDYFEDEELEVTAPNADITFDGDMKSLILLNITQTNTVINDLYSVQVIYPSYFDDGTRPQGHGDSKCLITGEKEFPLLFAALTICWMTAATAVTVLILISMKNRKSLCFCCFKDKRVRQEQEQVEQRPFGMIDNSDDSSEEN
jgi:hypothetical protein